MKLPQFVFEAVMLFATLALAWILFLELSTH